MSEPGWYPDPGDGARARYWDGASWTDRTRPIDDATSRVPAAAPGGSGGSWFRRPVTWMVVAGVVVVALVAGAVLVVVGGDDAAAGEVILEPADDDGDDPFFASVATSSVEVEAGGVGEVGGLAEGVESLSGATPGLYGGTGHDAVCDQEALVEFLEGDADKASAFADVVGIAPGDTAEYVAGLTPVLLREDTRVTNHGFADGRATPRQAVFQAGTAVLVDDLGVPRVRCACGNPLAEPEATAGTPTFAGDPWAGFDDARLVAVAQASEAQSSFELVDVATGEPYSVPVTSGEGMTVDALLNVVLPGWGHAQCGGPDAQLVDGIYECAYEIEGDSFAGDAFGVGEAGSTVVERLVVLGVDPPWCADPTGGPDAGCDAAPGVRAAVGDLTGDGRNEGVIVLVSDHSNTSAPLISVLAFTSDGSPLPLPPSAGADSELRPVVTGVEDVAIIDGELEVLTGDSGRTLRYRWDGAALVQAS